MHFCAHVQTHQRLLFIESDVKLSSSEECRGSQVLKQTVPCVKDIQTHVQVHSGDGPVRAWPGHITVLFLDRFKPLLVQELQQSICVLWDVKKGTGPPKSSMKFNGFIFVQKSKRHLWSRFVSQILKYVHSVSLKWLDSVNTLSHLWHLWKYMINEQISAESCVFFSL